MDLICGVVDQISGVCDLICGVLDLIVGVSITKIRCNPVFMSWENIPDLIFGTTASFFHYFYAFHEFC